MTSPFDDPQFRAQMAKMGVVHQPGMAADLLEALAPPLKADGVDLDDLGDTDLETLNSAMARATERRNLELMTPIGAQRASAIATLGVFTTAIADSDATLAQSVIESVEPEAAAPAATVSHVIGVGLGLLDDWHANDDLRLSMSRARVPAWHRKQSRAAASDMLPLGGKGRAFDAADGLIRRSRGPSVLEGVALAVAGSLIAVTDSAGEPLESVADRMLGNGAPREGSRPRHPAPPHPSGSAFVRPVASHPGGISGNRARRAAGITDQRLRREFTDWLKGQHVDDLAGLPPSDHAANVLVLVGAMRAATLELTDPADFDDIIDLLYDAADESGDDEMLAQQLDLLHTFVHFQIDVSDPDAWKEAHESIEAALSDLMDGGPNPLGDVLADAVADADLVPADERLAAYAQLPIVRSVPDLVEWIGNSRPVTPAGAVRRADIAELAGFLGINAIGVPRVEDPSGEHGPMQVKSMNDLAELRSWWDALQICDVIEVTPTRVRPGTSAARWSVDAAPSFDDVEKLIGMFIAEMIDPNEGKRFERIAADAVLRGLVVALAPDDLDDSFDDPYGLFTAIGESRMRRLTALGLVDELDEGEFRVPNALRGVVANGVLSGLSMQAAMEELDLDEWE